MMFEIYTESWETEYWVRKLYGTIRNVSFLGIPELSANSQGPSNATKLFCWEQELKAPALLHMENGTGTGFALHFFLLRWHKPSSTKSKHTNVCEQPCVSHRHPGKHKQIHVSQLPLQMICLRITWFLAGLGATVTRDQGLEHTSLHTHHTQRQQWGASQLLLCAATIPAHPEPLLLCKGTCRNQLSFQNPGKGE